jgi:hypothetical protein
MRLPQPIYIASIILFLIAIHIFAAAPTIPKFGRWLYDWQDLVAGVLALVGAYWAVMGIRQQIDVSERHEQMRLRRQHNAVRATLPLTLSGLIEPLRDMMRALDAVRPDVRANGFTSAFNPPAVPAQYVAELQAVIASTDQRDVIVPISEVIRQIQTLWARVETLRDEREQRRRAGLEMNIDDWIMQAAQIHAIIESLFDYARDESDQGPKEVSWERAESIIFQLGIESRNLVQRVRRGLEKSPNFWTLQ